MKILLDTNVMLDFLLRRNYYYQVKVILQNCAMGKCSGFITANSLRDIYFVLYEYYHSNNLAKKAMAKLLMVLTVLDCTGKEACNAFNDFKRDYEVAFMLQTAYNNKIDAIITTNINGFGHQERIMIIHPSNWKDK